MTTQFVIEILLTAVLRTNRDWIGLLGEDRHLAVWYLFLYCVVNPDVSSGLYRYCDRDGNVTF